MKDHKDDVDIDDLIDKLNNLSIADDIMSIIVKLKVTLSINTY
jgi:hypothetical protein